MIAAVAVLSPGVVFAQAGTGGGPAACSAGRAQAVIGKPYTPDLAEQARQAARAKLVRKIEPGGAYTMDFSPDRLNVEVDRTGIVRELTCG